jgi:hypothetical protein
VIPAGPESGSVPDPSIADTVARALGSAGGAELVVAALARIPGTVHREARRSMFRSEPEAVDVAQWRYHVLPDGRLSAAHVVGGIVLAEGPLVTADAGDHVAHAVDSLVAAHGARILPDVVAAFAGLAAACG